MEQMTTTIKTDDFIGLLERKIYAEVMLKKQCHEIDEKNKAWADDLKAVLNTAYSVSSVGNAYYRDEAVERLLRKYLGDSTVDAAIEGLKKENE